jgi:hypothetical protein
MSESPEFLARVEELLSVSVAALDPAERAERIAWCQATGRHGIRARIEGDLLVFTWADRPLVMVQAADLEAGGRLVLEPMPEIPDSPDGLE